MDPGNRRAVLAAMLANAGIAAAKLVGWGFTGAASMLAEAVHSLADTCNQALLLWGASAATRRPTASHPFGYGRERYFWSFVVALVIFLLGGLFALQEGVSKLVHPHALEAPRWALGILVLAIALEAVSFRTALAEARRVKGRTSWWRFVRRTKSPELPVVLLEDLGALLGLVLALVAVGLAAATGEPRFDAVGSIGIGLLLCAIALVLAVEMRSLLIGEAALPVHLDRIESALLGGPELSRIIHLRTQHLGPEELLIAAKVELSGATDLAAVAAAIDAAEARVRAALPVACVIYLEPDVYAPVAGEGA